MPHPPRGSRPAAGLYESLLTDRLEQYVETLSAQGWQAVREEVGDHSAPHVLARYVADRVEQALHRLEPEERVAAANRLLDLLDPLDGTGDDRPERVADGPRRLLALVCGLSEKSLVVHPLRDRTTSAMLRAASSGFSCSQKRRTTHPFSSRRRVVSRSLARLRSTLLAQ